MKDSGKWNNETQKGGDMKSNVAILCLIVAICLLPVLSQAFAYSYNLGAPSVGDTPLTLNSVTNGGSDSFSSVLRQGAGYPTVGVILLHGRGESLYDGHVILPLRLALNAVGYTTLSIDTPVPKFPPPLPVPADPYNYSNFQFDASTGANYVFPELYARIRSATDELKSLGIGKAVLIGFSLGSRMGSAYMHYGSAGSIPIVAFAGIGMGRDAVASVLDTPTSLTGVTVPVLDLYGSLDNSDVVGVNAIARKSAYSGCSYAQFMQVGSDHQWVGFEAQLISYIENWITVADNNCGAILTPKISVSPMSVNLGSVKAGGTSNPRTVTVKNTGKGDLIINSMTISGANQLEFIESNNCSIVPAKSSCPITVTLEPFPPFVKKSAIMSISSNDPKKPTINVKLLGQSLPPKITVSPKSVSFGSVAVGSTSAPKIVTIKNTGISDLTVNAIAFEGTNAVDFSQTNNCTVVAKGSSCAISVTFSPTSTGSETAMMSISSNDPKKQITNVKLNGKGSGGSTPPSVDITGGWNIYKTTNGTPGEVGPALITLAQTGNSISGTKPGGQPITGSISGLNITMSWTDLFIITASGTVSADGRTMSGTWSASDGRLGTWRAIKITTPSINDFVGNWQGSVTASAASGETGTCSASFNLAINGNQLTGQLAGSTCSGIKAFTATISGTVTNGIFSFNLPNDEPGDPDCANWDMPITSTLSADLKTMNLNGSGTVCSSSGGQPGSLTGSLTKIY